MEEDLAMIVDTQSSGPVASMSANGGRNSGPSESVSADVKTTGVAESTSQALYMCYGDIVDFKVDSKDRTVTGYYNTTLAFECY